MIGITNICRYCVIVDAPQLFYHIGWPHGDRVADDLMAPTQHHLSNYGADTEIVIICECLAVSANDHERMRRAANGAIYY